MSDLMNKSSKKVKSKKNVSIPADGAPDIPVEKLQEETDKVRRKREKKKKKRKRAEEGGEDAKSPRTTEEENKKKKKTKHSSEDAFPTKTPVIQDPVLPADSLAKKKRKRDDGAKDAFDPTSSLDSKTTKRSKHLEPSIQPSQSATATATEVSEFLIKNNIALVPHIIPYLSFSALPIPSSLSSPLSRFPAPTPVQACTWPSALGGKDVVGIAETGSGKTLAFGIPALAKLLANPPKKDGITTLVLAPTRELAMQTNEQLVEIGKPFGIGSVAVYGGAPKEGQIRLLKNMDKKKDGLTTRIVVGTPGRMLDLISEGACELGGVDYLVLDEADRMLDQGFEQAIRQIVGFTKPKESRQTMMFSATWPESIRRLADSFQRDPARVTVGSEDLTANSRVDQYVEVFDDDRSKDSRLLKHLREILPGKGKASDVRVLVFALYKPEASRVTQVLQREGYRACALHGDLKQTARTAALEEFKSGKANVMVATDVAARGLDIPGVEVVINYTFPLKVEDYVHRIGRTGRGGRSGKAITFYTGCGPYEKGLAGEYAKLLTDGGYDAEAAKLAAVFPMTIKKKEHSAYGAFFRDDIAIPTDRKKIVF